MPRYVPVTMSVNGSQVEARVSARLSLADFLREELGLTGTHLGCEHGVCGACTVLLDGHTVRSCLVLAAQAADHSITTVEGLGVGEDLSPLQQAFSEAHGLQCGFCTPGFLATATELLAEGLPEDDRDLKELLSGNICRCTGYQGIVAAVRRAEALCRDREPADVAAPAADTLA